MSAKKLSIQHILLNMGMTDLGRHTTEIRSLVTGQFAISYTAFFISRFGIIFAIDTERTLGHPVAYGVFFSVTGEVIRLIILLIADKTYLAKRLKKPAKLWVVVATWFLSSLIGSLIPGIVLETLTNFQGHLLIRVVPSTFFSFAGFALSSIIVAQVTTQRRQLRKSIKLNVGALKEEAETLDNLFRAQEIREEHIRMDVAKGLQGLRAQIESISEKTKDEDITKLLETIEDYNRKVIRNYSHSLMPALKEVANSKLIPSAARPTLRYLFELKNLNFSPILCSTIIFVINIPLQVSRNGLSGFYFSLILITLLGPSLTAFFLLIRRFIQERFIDRILAIASSLSLIYVGLDFMARNLRELLDQPFPYPPQITAFRTTLAVLVISIAVTLQRRAEYLKKELDSSLVETNRASAVNIEVNIRMKRELAHLLHGPLQGKLSSVAMSLNLFLTQEPIQKSIDGDKWVTIAGAKIQEMISEIERSSHSEEFDPNVPAFLKLLSLEYEPLLNISSTMEPETSRVLSEDFELARATEDVISNAVTNSLVHGAAKNVQIRIDSSSLSQVRVQVTDDGVGLKEKFEAGFGLNHINALSETWSLKKNGKKGTLLTAILSRKP
jgi:signal transduction histidine kinase